MRIHDNVGQLGVLDQRLRNKMVTAKDYFDHVLNKPAHSRLSVD